MSVSVCEGFRKRKEGQRGFEILPLIVSDYANFAICSRRSQNECAGKNSKSRRVITSSPSDVSTTEDLFHADFIGSFFI